MSEVPHTDVVVGYRRVGAGAATPVGLRAGRRGGAGGRRGAGPGGRGGGLAVTGAAEQVLGGRAGQDDPRSAFPAGALARGLVGAGPCPESGQRGTGAAG
ncbi:hypothetical protein C0Q61_30785 [Streptomyces albidoflavus]|nr:hypothetical protein C0Q61_30785 [Streptomyces albidoflavus]